MKRIAALAALVMLLGLLAAPTRADVPASLDEVSGSFGVQTDTSGSYSVYFSDSDTYSYFQVGQYQPSPYGYWACRSLSAYPDSLELQPDMTLKGKDVILLSGEFDSLDFDDCYSYGTFVVPDMIVFDVTLEAAVVYKTDTKRKYVKGEGPDYKEQRWTGDQATVDGTFQGDDVTNTQYGYWHTLKLH